MTNIYRREEKKPRETYGDARVSGGKNFRGKEESRSFSLGKFWLLKIGSVKRRGI